MSLQELLSHPSPIDSYSFADTVRQIWAALLDPSLSLEERRIIETFLRNNKDQMLREPELEKWKTDVARNWRKVVQLVFTHTQDLCPVQKLPPMTEEEFTKRKPGPKPNKNLRKRPDAPEWSEKEEAGQGHWEALIHKAQYYRAQRDQITNSIQQLEQTKADCRANIAQLETKIAEIESQLNFTNKAQSDLDVQVAQLQIEGKASYERFHELLLLQ